MAIMKSKTNAGAVDDNATKRVKTRNKTLKDMSEVSGNYQEPKNPIDRAMENETRADEESRGITETLRNVWDVYTD